MIRENPVRYAPTGMCHLILEVLAYAADEAEDRGAGRAVVEFHPDGSVSVSDDGRGTQMAASDDGRPVRKPVMATKDLRYFDSPPATPIPDGRPRYGMSVVAALSEWLVHTNRRAEGAWTQRYRHGVPAGELVAVPSAGTTGTTVRFHSVEGLGGEVSAESVRPLADRVSRVLVVEV